MSLRASIILAVIKGNGKMWFLLWMQFFQNTLKYHQLSQHDTQIECMKAKDDAKVLVTSSTIMVQCFEVKIGN